MKEHPILFTVPMVRAILAGRKTQTRRVKKGEKCPYGQAGDLLWVKEPFSYYCDAQHVVYKEREGAELEADGTDTSGCWTSSWFMPRWASRITLQIIGVRIERVKDITDSDCFAEGIQQCVDDGFFISDGTVRGTFRGLWDSINAKRGHGWDKNPKVWVIEFKKSSGE